MSLSKRWLEDLLEQQQRAADPDYDEALAELESRQADELDALAEQWDEYLADCQEQESP
ncbi:MAG: hypothetical protein KDE23_24595 [Caldilinea sp.]|nr:hypothetical protein [Caldilinea sp.]